MDALLASTVAVFIAEIGDKTQLLSLLLVTRFHQRTPIILGILVATLINHAISAWIGNWLADWLPQEYLPWILGGSFLLMAAWLLIPDKEDEEDSRFMAMGAFLATSLLFFLAEIGDKTQIATVILAARYDAMVPVVIGTTLGMLAANVPIIIAGKWLMERLPLKAARIGACLLFLALGLFTLMAGVPEF